MVLQILSIMLKKSCPTNIFQKSLKLPFPEYGTTSLSYLWCPYLNQQGSTANQLQGKCNIQMQPEKLHTPPRTCLEYACFRIIRPAIKPLFPEGVTLGGVG